MPMNYFILLKFILIFCLFVPLVRASPTEWIYFKDEAFVAFVEKGWDSNAAFEAHKKALLVSPKDFNPSAQNAKMLEAHFGVLYLMKQKWHCGEIIKKLTTVQAQDCNKYSKYANILYEYLLQVYAKKGDIVKPVFTNYAIYIVGTVRELCWISQIYFDKEIKEIGDLARRAEGILSLPVLKNEKEFDVDKMQKDNYGDAREEFNKKLEEFASKAIEIANDKKMAEKERIVRQIWQGHPFLKQSIRGKISSFIHSHISKKEQEALSKNGEGNANDNKNKEKTVEKKPNEEPSKKGKKEVIE